MQSLHRLFCFPKFTLYPLVRRGVHKRRQVERVLAERLREWREGNFQFLFAEMPGDQQRKYDLRPRGDSAMVVDEVVSEKLREAVAHAVNEGSLSKAARVLMSKGITERYCLSPGSPDSPDIFYN